MVKRSPTLVTLVSTCTKTKSIKLISIGKITLVPVAFLMALSILDYSINKIFHRKIVIIFLPIIFHICFGCSKEPSHRDGSFEYPQHMF